MKRRRYPEYKDSGIEWLREIPSDWRVLRAKLCSRLNMGQSPSSEDCNMDGIGLPFLQGNAEFGTPSPSPKLFCEAARKITEKDDLLISVRAPVGALNVADQRYGIGRGLCAITPNSRHLDHRFSWYLLQHVRTGLKLEATGSTYDAVSVEDVGNLLFVLPSSTEQHTIATFLDRETARIDGLIAKKQRQIELLQEKRAAIISHAVTKGLNPNVKMKDSGVEWLGEIPEGWEVLRLKNVARFSYGDSLAANDRIPGDYDVYGSNGIVGQHERPNTKAPCLIIGRKGSFGKVAYSEKPCFTIDTTYFVDSTLTKNHLRWLYYCLQWLRLDSFTKDSAVPGIAREDAYENLVLFCPKDEQRAIAAFLDRETARIDGLIKKVKESIDLLREYRTALVSAAVTGKIDVRKEVV